MRVQSRRWQDAAKIIYAMGIRSPKRRCDSWYFLLLGYYGMVFGSGMRLLLVVINIPSS